MATDDAPLPLSAKVNQLFLTFHTRTEPEQTPDDVAKAISIILDRIVPASEIEAMRAGGRDDSSPDRAVLSALAQHFEVPPEYLIHHTGIPDAVHEELCLLEAAREAQVRKIAMRGDEVDIAELTNQLARLPKAYPSPSDQQN